MKEERLKKEKQDMLGFYDYTVVLTYISLVVSVFGPLLLPSMLLSRGISYYGQMLISALMTCVAHLTIGRKNEEIQRM